MSNKELDNLFKNKLEEFNQTPTQDLWGQIDKQLEPKQKKPMVWFLSIAASIVLLIAVGISIYISEDCPGCEDNKMMSLNDTPPKGSLNEPIKEIKTAENTRPAFDSQVANKNSTEENNESLEPEATHSIKKESKNKSASTTELKTPVIESVQQDYNTVALNKVTVKEKNPGVLETKGTQDFILEERVNIAKNDIPHATDETNSASKTSKGKSVIFDISEFSQKSAMAQIEVEEKKQSKLKKIFNIAKDIKQGESGLKDLREAKNELFALGNKKEENGK